MANTITFKFLDSDSTEPIESLSVTAYVQVAACLTPYQKPTGPQKIGQSSAVYTLPEVINESTFTQGLTTDGDGLIDLDITGIFVTQNFLSIWNKFNGVAGYNVSFVVTLVSDKQDVGGTVYVGSKYVASQLFNINVTRIQVGPGYSFPDVYYPDYDDNFYVEGVVVDKEKLYKKQTEKIAAERDYVDQINAYKSDLISQSILQIPNEYEYNPLNFSQIITRSQELSIGVLENGLTFATDAGLVALRLRLQGIKNRITSLSNLYPNITVDMGEGQPYTTIGVIPEVFQSFSFYNDGDLFFQYTLSNVFYEKFGDATKLTVTVSLNGVDLWSSGSGSSFVINVSEILNGKQVVGDSVNVLVFFEKDPTFNWNSKLIIK
jgi:hypothetical protein